jgi:hypothetical protein
LVNSDKVEVTANLEIALRHLREQEDDVTLWIDALVTIFLSNEAGNRSLMEA